jgi:hypothetical protein
MWAFFEQHGTKLLGFLGVTIGVLAASTTSILPPSWMPYILLLNGLLTAWRGFVNDKNGNP